MRIRLALQVTELANSVLLKPLVLLRASASAFYRPDSKFLLVVTVGFG
jgi:hypothetical protein